MENTLSLELTKQTLFNTRAKECNVIGWCWKHKCWMTEKQLKQKGCLGHQCPALLKKEDHPYWLKREKKKLLKREAKHAWDN